MLHRCLYLLLVSITTGMAAQPLRVVAVLPTPEAVAGARDAPIVLTFDAPVNLATAGPHTLMVFGRWSGVMTGTLAWQEGNTRMQFTPDRPFSAGERVTVALARTLAAAQGEALSTGYTWQFWAPAAPASLELVEGGQVSIRTTGEGWIQSYGAYGGDLNGDGALDLAVPNERSNDVRVFLNDGTGSYDTPTVYPLPNGGRPSPNEGTDLNRDGVTDLVVGNSTNQTLSVLLGTGDGEFAPILSYTTDPQVRGVTTLDLEGDGFVDVVTANRYTAAGGTVSILYNNQQGGLGNATSIDAQGLQETAVEAADLNGDGLLDVVVGALESQEVSVLLGDGNGHLTYHATVPSGGATWMLATGDVNGDGHVDVASANSTSHHVSILPGDGHGNLGPPVIYPTGAFPLAVDLGDLDGDGDLDLVTSNYEGVSWTVYENAGEGTFTQPRTLPATGAGSCAVLHDRTGDGTLDLTGIDEVADRMFLFTNPLPESIEPASSEGFLLYPPYPQPFSEVVTFSFRLPRAATVRLVVLDVEGRVRLTLAHRPYPSGVHTVFWDGTLAGQRLPAGVYLLQGYADGHVHTRTVVYHP